MIIDVYLTGLVCEKTTDDTFQGPTDETFLLVFGRRGSDGKQHKQRFPGRDGTWDLRGTPGHPMGLSGLSFERPLQLLRDDLADGDYVDVLIYVWEEDSGVVKEKFDDLGNQLISKGLATGNVLSLAAGALEKLAMNVLGLGDALGGDLIGTVGIRISNDRGTISWDTSGKTSARRYETKPGAHLYELTGRGSKYTIGIGAARR